MEKQNIDFSIIIPQRNSIKTLGRLFDSIPLTDRIEIILVDNSPTPITKEEVGIDRDYDLYWAAPERFAGGARNVGVEHAHGKWLLFADADDYFSEGAFDVFFSEIDDKSELIYFGMTGIYEDTGEYSPRGEYYTQKVKSFLSGEIKEEEIRYHFGSPCSKMVRKSLVDRYKIRFDEIIACNDSFFSLQVGYYAKSIKAIDFEVYVATVSRGSLTKRKDFEALHSRYLVQLRRNDFLKRNEKANFQGRIMSRLYECCKSAPYKTPQLLYEAISYRQNIFKGFDFWRWMNTLLKKKDH